MCKCRQNPAPHNPKIKKKWIKRHTDGDVSLYRPHMKEGNTRIQAQCVHLSIKFIPTRTNTVKVGYNEIQRDWEFISF